MAPGRRAAHNLHLVSDAPTHYGNKLFQKKINAEDYGSFEDTQKNQKTSSVTSQKNHGLQRDIKITLIRKVAPGLKYKNHKQVA